MDDVHAIWINLISSVLWVPIGALLGAIVLGVGYFIQVRLPRRRLWRLTSPENLIVCAANSTITNTGIYHRPATGVGQVRALTLAVKSLSKAYNQQLDIKNILFSTERLQERIENDLLLLGGPKNNQISAKFLKLMSDQQPVLQTPEKIIWRVKQVAGKWVEDGAYEYTGEAENKNIVLDYGLVMRVQSPFTSSPRTVVLLSGDHTYGLIAAAKYFTEDLQKSLRWFKRVGKRNIVILVSAHIIDEHPAQIKLERYFAW